MGIRQKLWVGIGALLLILLLASGSAIWVIRRGNQAVDAVFRNNGDSVFYMHELSDGLDQLNDGLKAALAQDRPLDPALVAPNLSKVERSWAGEANCVSEAGEREAWVGLGGILESYKSALRVFFKPGMGQEQRRNYFKKVLEPKALGMKGLAWQIAGLNLKNSQFRDHGREEAWAVERWMALLLLSGVVLGVGLVLMGGRALLGPILELTRSVREIEKGNLDLSVAISSDDELGQLAAAFNSMASRLKAFQRGVRARLLRTQKTTQMAINSFSDPVAVLGLGARIDMCNLAAEEIFELKPGMQLSQSQLSRLDILIAPVLHLGRAYEPKGYGEAFQVFHRGREKFMLPRLVPVLDEQKQVVGVTLFLEDVTALRKLDEMKSGLLATVSHELKNPLTSLRLATHFLLEESPGPLTEKQRELALTLQSEGDRLHSILEELLTLGRMDAEKDFLKCSPQTARSLILDSLGPLEVSVRSKRLKVGFKIPLDLPMVFADPQRISHVFSNLYENAIKYSPAESLIEIGVAQEGANLRFWVRDSGPGIPQAYRSKIFERFFRVPGREVGIGSGLGLAIAKEIVEMHGGFLSVDSEEGQGATFSFMLPSGGFSLPSPEIA